MNTQPAQSGPAERPTATSRGAFQNWRIIAVAAAGQSLGIGLVGNYQVLVTPLAAEFGATQVQMGMGMTLLLASGGIGATLMGPVADRGPLRAVMLLGVVAMLGSVLALSSAQSLSQLALCAALFGAATSLYGHVPANVLLVSWFKERRGTAVALAAMGMSIGGMGMPPLLTWLVDRIGWRDSISAVAVAVALVLVPIFTFWVTGKPTAKSASPEPAAPEPASPPDSPSADDSLRGILGQGNFWRLALGLGLATCAAIGMSVFLIPYLEGLGVSRQRAAWAPSILAACSFCAKPLIGLAADRLHLRGVVLGVLSLYTLGWTLLSLVPTFSAALFASALLGVGAGGLLVLSPLLIGASFDAEMVGRVTGFQVPIAMPFILAIPPALGYVRDTTGSFAPAFMGLAALVVLAALLLLSIRFRQNPAQAA